MSTGHANIGLVAAREVSGDHFAVGDVVYFLASPTEAADQQPRARLRISPERALHVTGEPGMWLTDGPRRMLAPARYLIHDQPACDTCATFAQELREEIRAADYDADPETVLLYTRLPSDHLVHIEDYLRLGPDI